MGMRVGGTNAMYASQSTSSVNNWQQRQQKFKALSSALESGDLGAAQQAFSAISANNTNINSSSPLGQIGKSLQVGDITGAQTAAVAWRSSHQPNSAQSSRQAMAGVSGNLLETVMQSLSQAGINPSGTSTAGGATAGTATQSAQAVSSFMQNLFAALKAQDSNATTASTANTTAAASTTTAATTAASATALAPASGASQGTPSVGHHHRHHGGDSGQFGSELNSLIANLSSTDSSNIAAASGSTDATAAATSSGPTTAASQLQQSFKNMLNSLGANTSSTSLNSFLQTFSQNMQGMSASGNIINTQA
jgi:hypothetical protein